MKYHVKSVFFVYNNADSMTQSYMFELRTFDISVIKLHATVLGSPDLGSSVLGSLGPLVSSPRVSSPVFIVLLFVVLQHLCAMNTRACSVHFVIACLYKKMGEPLALFMDSCQRDGNLAIFMYCWLDSGKIFTVVL